MKEDDKDREQTAKFKLEDNSISVGGRESGQNKWNTIEEIFAEDKIWA